MIFQFETGYSIQFQDGEKLPKKKRDAADYRKDCFLKGGLSWIPKPISENIIVDALQKKMLQYQWKKLKSNLYELTNWTEQLLWEPTSPDSHQS